MAGGAVNPLIMMQFIHNGGERVTVRAFHLILALLLVLMLPSCGGSDQRSAVAADPAVAGRFITPELWAGGGEALHASNGRLSIRGPFTMNHPAGGHRIQAYERISLLGGNHKRQLLTITQNGAGLGRVLDERTGLPTRRFTGDIVFPTGVWKQGEVREFMATEHTLFGPAQRIITLEILKIDSVYGGVAHSLSYRLAIRDEAGRILDCEQSVYSPGLGLVAFEANSYWRADSGCKSCPCQN